MENTNNMTIEEEVMEARGGAATLGDRLDKSDAKITVTEYELINLYDEAEIIKNQYYKEGVLIASDTTDTMPPVSVKKGDKVFISGTQFLSRYVGTSGVRIGMFNGEQWLYDLTPAQTKSKVFIEIPDGVTMITVPYFADDTNRYLRIFKEDEISENLYDANTINTNKYYVEGVLKTQAGVDSTPLMPVNPGEKYYASSFNFQYSATQDLGGVRVGMFKDSVWVKDLTQYDVYQRPYIVIPEGVNQITIPFWSKDTNRAVYRYLTAAYGENLYDENKVIAKKYYIEGVLDPYGSIADTMPLVDVEEGDRVYASSFGYKSKLSVLGGVRVGFYRNYNWVYDMLQMEVYNKRYIEIPAGITQISIPFWRDETNRYLYIDKAGHGINTEIPVNKKIKKLQRELKEIHAGDMAYSKIAILGDETSAFKEHTAGDYAAEYPNPRNFTEVDNMWWKKLMNRCAMYLVANESASGRLVTWDGTTEDDTQGAAKHMASQVCIDNLSGANQTPGIKGVRAIPDMIFVYGGKNDADSNVSIGTFTAEDPSAYTEEQIAALPVNTFADAYRTMLIRLLKTYPTTKIVCVLPDFTSVYESGTRLSECCNIIREACDYFCIDTISLKNAGLSAFNKNTYLYKNKIPTESGMELIYRQIKRQL